jgi:hypothetical protein
MNIVEAIHSVFSQCFADLETWSPWKTLLRAAFCLQMSRKERKLYRTCTQRRRLPKRPIRELFVIAGRRAGKSFISALIAVFLALFFDYSRYLTAGERGVILIVAADRAQAGVIFRYIAGILHSTVMLEQCIVNETKERIELNTGIDIKIATCNYRTIRGRTVVAFIGDETAFWLVDGANPDHEIISSVRPSMATIPNAMLICISTPYARRGVLWEAYEHYYGNDKAEDVLVWQAPSIVMNPTLDKQYIDREIAKDKSAGEAEWLARWRTDIETFLDLETIMSAVVEGRLSLPYNRDHSYHAFVDVSGGRSDAAAVAIGHESDNRLIVDCVRYWPAPHNPAQVIGEVCEVLKEYRVQRVQGDRYAGDWPRQEFEERNNVIYETADMVKSDIYLSFAAYANSDRVELLDVPRLINELKGLERRRGRTGRDIVDHQARGHDDVANAVAGLVCQLADETSGTMPLIHIIDVPVRH